MNRRIFAFAFLSTFTMLAGCSGDDSNGAAPDGGAADATQSDGSSGADSGPVADSSTSHDSSADTGPSSDSGSASDASDASDASAADAAHDGGDGGDAGAIVVNGCTTFEDHTAAADARKILFPTNGAPAQYTPNCMKVKVGQTVDWNGGFSAHPLEPFGGDAPNPIIAQSAGTDETVTFATAGVYGFHCAAHPNLMFGAIQVVP